MKADILNKKGEKKSKIDLPIQFSEKFRPIVILRAFNSNQSFNYQHFGTDPIAGLRHVTYASKRRHIYRSVYGAGRSRTPKKIMVRRGNRMQFVADQAPHARKGRTAHPPLVIKKFEERINKKEKLLAIRSAISATTMEDVVKARNHRFTAKLPIIVSDIEKLDKTKDVSLMLEKVGVKDDLIRANVKKVRAGKGKMRGRKYKTKKGPLIVVSEICPLLRSARAIAGVETITVKHLNATVLAPGGVPGRLTVWSKKAVEELKTKKLFLGGKK